jgi:hypothetical protein
MDDEDEEGAETATSAGARRAAALARPAGPVPLLQGTTRAGIARVKDAPLQPTALRFAMDESDDGADALLATDPLPVSVEPPTNLPTPMEAAEDDVSCGSS